MEVAEALNEAYALQEPVKKLLDKHRFLALSRAPLKQRLAVLWKLVEQDPTIGSWETDASEMERARLREMEVEARDAVKHVDAPSMNAIAEELEHGKWIEAISQQFKAAIAQSAREITRRTRGRRSKSWRRPCKRPLPNRRWNGPASSKLNGTICRKRPI